MKTLIGTVFAVLLAMVFAFWMTGKPTYMPMPEKANLDWDEAEDFCTYVQDHSLDIMEARQMVREFTWAMQKYGKDEWSKAAVEDAFRSPVYLTQDDREEAIREFAQESFIYCMKHYTRPGRWLY